MKVPTTERKSRRRWVSLTAVVLMCLVALGGAHRPVEAAAKPRGAPRKPRRAAALVGLERITAELGRATPTGRGIVTGHVEAGRHDAYMPNADHRRTAGVRFIPRSGASKISAHADSTAGHIYGERGLANGVTQVHCFAVKDWLAAGCLGTGTTRPPAAGLVRVFNHSWVGVKGRTEFAEAALRRVDYLVDTYDAIVVAGVNNSPYSSIPPLLASAYNAIAIGQWDGHSSGGYTRIEQPDRCKPDLVAPGGRVSSAAPVVTALVARLLEVADQMGGNACRAEVIKAVLMAGADKPPEWAREEGKPLARHYGAGRVRFDRSYYLLRRGPLPPGFANTRYGWSFHSAATGTTSTWRMDSPAACGEVSIILTWHRRIDGRVVRDPESGRTGWDDRPRLADFDLALVRLDDDGAAHTAAASRSRIDNVEHIYLTELPAGRYRLEVSRRDELAEAWDFALAWRFERPRRAD